MGTVRPPVTRQPIATVVAMTPCPHPPDWASSEIALFAALDRAWRDFERQYFHPDGRLRYEGEFGSRDGADDFYEAIFNWPLLYLLGGADDLLTASRKHWEAIGRQLSDGGLLRDGYEVGYDWFHQGESMLVFYFLCLAAPDDSHLQESAARFADLYLGGPPNNYDPEKNIIRAPHTGSGGPRQGLVDGNRSFPWDPDLRSYGLPLDWVPGISSFDQLTGDAQAAARMGQEMHDRLGRGDIAVNLAATSLCTNAFLMTGDGRYNSWVSRYTNGWLDRATDNGGIVPDNVGLSGRVGEYLEGRWYGGHYGWSWPHGLHTVGAAAIIASVNAALLTGDDQFLELGRGALNGPYSHGKRVRMDQRPPTSMPGRWEPFLQVHPPKTEIFTVPNRINDSGWFDFQPVQVSFPMALWHFSAAPEDRGRIEAIRDSSGHDWGVVALFRDKEEAGHEEAYFSYLSGDNPGYPTAALAMAISQVRQRLQRMKNDNLLPDQISIHHWQDHNPVVTEILAQLTLGAPQVLYNGGLLQARVRYYDAVRRRAGLPADVAALVESIDPAAVVLRLVNTSTAATRQVTIQAGAFAEHRIESICILPDSAPLQDGTTNPDDDAPVSATGGSLAQVVMPPASRIRLKIRLSLRALEPTYCRPWDD